MKKICKECNIRKDISSFYKNRKMKDGYLNSCKSCVNSKSKERYHKNHEENKRKRREYHSKVKDTEKYKATRKRYYEENKISIQKKNHENRKKWRRQNREEYNIQQTEYRKENKDKVNTYQRSYYKLNKDKLLKQQRDRRSKNPDWKRYNIAKSHRRRVKMRNMIGVSKLGSEDIKLVHEMCNYMCSYCGSKENLTIDHVIPISKGGDNSLHNLTTACKSCNSSKGSKGLMLWLCQRS